jgi:hypothetical protein
MYTPLEEAKVEVWKRWKDAGLRRRVIEYVTHLPDGYGSEPCAVLSRYIATPNFETHRFQEIAEQSGIKMICDVFPHDKFCSVNTEKYHLAEMKFYPGNEKNNGTQTSNVRLVTIHEVESKPFSQLTTQCGNNFVKFHNRLFCLYFSAILIVDTSTWINKFGKNLSEYYDHYFALFICHGILFENFLLTGNEKDLTKKIVQPAFRKIYEHFGLKPLIVRLLPEESESDPYWCWYPGHLEEEVRRLMTEGAATTGLQVAETRKAGL